MADTYPPDDHLMRDLRFESEVRPDGSALVIAPVDDETRDGSGGLRAGVLATVIDAAAAAVALRSVAPDWIATSDLAYHSTAPLTEGPALVSARSIRVGSGLVVIGASVVDGRGGDTVAGAPIVGSAIVTFSRIPGSATRARSRPGDGGHRRTTLALPGSGWTAALPDQLGVRIVDGASGALALEPRPYVLNSFGSVNGGAVALLHDLAAVAATEAFRSPAYVADLSVRYLAQSGDGPVETGAEILRRGVDAVAVRIEATDRSKTRDQLLSIANALVLPA